MIQLSDLEDVDIVAGTSQINIVPDRLFSDMSIHFLDELSCTIRNSAESKIYADLMAFSFWCRKGSIKNFKRKYHNLNQRLGRGLVFHITPSNVPLNFGYSFNFGLLSGNSNIVKIPSKEFLQADYLKINQKGGMLSFLKLLQMIELII